MASQDELIVRIGADFTELKNQLKKAGNETEKFGKKAKKSANTSEKAFAEVTKRAAGMAAAIVGAGKAMDAFNSTIERAKEITLFSDRLEISRERFGAYALITRRAGLETEDLFDAMNDLSLKITDAATGAKAYQEVLNKVGLRAKDLKRLNVEDQFLKFAEAASKADAKTRRFVADELGSDALLKFNKIIKESGGNLGKVADELIRAGKAQKEIDFEQLEKVAKAQRDLTLAWETFSDKMITQFAPQISSGLGMITQLFTTGQEGNMAKGIREATKALKEARKDASEDQDKEKSDDSSMEEQEVKDKISLWEWYWIEQAQIRQDARDAEKWSEADYHDAVYAAEVAQAERIKRLWEGGYKGRMMVAKDFFGSMSTLMQTENRKMFEIGKAAAIANATITTIESAQKSFNSLAGIPIVGPALGAAAAAAAIAGGVARIQQIQSTTMGGGGGVGGVSAAGATAGGEGGAEVINQTNVDVSLQGSTFSRDDVRGLINEINEQADDNFVVRAN